MQEQHLESLPRMRSGPWTPLPACGQQRGVLDCTRGFHARSKGPVLCLLWQRTYYNGNNTKISTAPSQDDTQIQCPVPYLKQNKMAQSFDRGAVRPGRARRKDAQPLRHSGPGSERRNSVHTSLSCERDTHQVLRTAFREGRHGTEWGSKDTPMLSILLFVKTQSKRKKTQTWVEEGRCVGGVSWA